MSDTEATGTESVENGSKDTESLTETEGVEETKETKEKELRDAEGWPLWAKQGPKRHQRNEAFKPHDTIGDFQDHHLKVVAERDEAIKTRDEALKAAEGTIKIPNKDSSDEEVQEFYKGLGRPDKAEDYELEKPELPEGVKINENLEKQARNWFFDAKLSGPQAQLIYEGFNQHVINSLVAQAEAEEKAIEEANKELREKLWKTEEEYKENVKLVQRTAKTFGGEEFEKLLDTVEVNGVKLGNHPVFLKAMATIGAAMGEDKFIEGETTTGGVGGNTEEAKLKEKYKDSLVKDGIPYRQDVTHKTEDSEAEKELKKRYPKMQITS